MEIRSIAVKIAFVALIISLALNAYYFVSIRVENEKVLNNMRSIALGIYGGEVSGAAYFLEIFANTWNHSALDIARGNFRNARQQAELCLQGLPDDPDSMYTVLRDTAFSLDGKFGYIPLEAYNATKIVAAVQLLRETGSAFFGMEIVRTPDSGMNPLERLGESKVDSVIANCEQILSIINW